MGLKDLNSEIESFINKNCKKIDKDVFLCLLNGKKFKGPEYVKKHIELKHREKLLDIRKDVEYFNRFVYDPKRPYLPEHPLSKSFENYHFHQQKSSHNQTNRSHNFSFQHNLTSNIHNSIMIKQYNNFNI